MEDNIALRDLTDGDTAQLVAWEDSRPGDEYRKAIVNAHEQRCLAVDHIGIFVGAIMVDGQRLNVVWLHKGGIGTATMVHLKEQENITEIWNPNPRAEEAALKAGLKLIRPGEEDEEDANARDGWSTSSLGNRNGDW